MSAHKLRLYHQLQIAAHQIQKTADREISRNSELTTAQAAVLSIVSGRDETTQKEVADLLGLNESAVTAMVTRLLGLSYLDRQRSETDRRAWMLSATVAGEAALHSVKTPFRRINKVIDGEFTDKELENLAEYLQRLSAAFEGERR